MIFLNNTTFIIPLCIESEDRFKNAKSVLGFLNHNFNTNVIIHEITDGVSKLNFINELNNLKIHHIIEKSDMNTYHRTRQLNEMLDIVDTEVVVNYDIDVILPVSSYVRATEMIINQKCDVVYPYGDGIFQKRIFTYFNRDNFNKLFNVELLLEDVFHSDMWNAKHGHCIFFNTKLYKNMSGENENFIAYGPEDTERFERFSKLGYKICRIDNKVIHFEHMRTSFSDYSNKHFRNNDILYNNLKKMSKEEVIEYYNNVEYKKKYKTFNK